MKTRNVTTQGSTTKQIPFENLFLNARSLSIRIKDAEELTFYKHELVKDLEIVVMTNFKDFYFSLKNFASFRTLNSLSLYLRNLDDFKLLLANRFYFSKLNIEFKESK